MGVLDADNVGYSVLDILEYKSPEEKQMVQKDYESINQYFAPSLVLVRGVLESGLCDATNAYNREGPLKIKWLRTIDIP